MVYYDNCNEYMPLYVLAAFEKCTESTIYENCLSTSINPPITIQHHQGVFLFSQVTAFNPWEASYSEQGLCNPDGP